MLPIPKKDTLWLGMVRNHLKPLRVSELLAARSG